MKPTARAAVLLFFAVTSSGCLRRERLNADCRWTYDAAVPLDLRNEADQRHLNDDVELAEDLAVRYGDRGLRAGHFASMEAYGQARNECLGTLFSVIASNHSVSTQQVHQSVGSRPAGLDLAVLLSFALLYGLVSIGLVGGIFSRFPVDGPVPAFAASVGMSAVVSAGGLMGLGLWAGTVEMIRAGNTHMSYRVGRLPWSHHTIGLFASGVFLFWLIALLRYRSLAHRAMVCSIDNHRVSLT
jgi:hypothetical protein